MRKGSDGQLASQLVQVDIGHDGAAQVGSADVVVVVLGDRRFQPRAGRGETPAAFP